MCTQKNAFPAIFKRVKVTALLKTEVISSDLNDYCPISILPVLTKPLEKYIHKHMTDFLKVHDLLHSSQSGFRRGHSTDAWLSAFNKRQISGAVFLDLRNTFDLVNYDILLKKAIGLQFKHRGYHILTILLTWSTTVRTRKWHILQ